LQIKRNFLSESNSLKIFALLIERDQGDPEERRYKSKRKKKNLKQGIVPQIGYHNIKKRACLEKFELIYLRQAVGHLVEIFNSSKYFFRSQRVYII